MSWFCRTPSTLARSLMRDAACAGRRLVMTHAAASATRASLEVVVIQFSPIGRVLLCEPRASPAESRKQLILKGNSLGVGAEGGAAAGTACPLAAEFAGPLPSLNHCGPRVMTAPARGLRH